MPILFVDVMSNYRNIFLVIYILLINSIQPAQPRQIKFNQIGPEQGLSQSTVQAVVQDKQGFLWFGTQDGLNRYDGYSMTVFKHDPSDPNSISDNPINCLLCDRNGNLWIGTERGGIDRYVPSLNRFYHYKYDKNNTSSISQNEIVSLFQDSKGNIWAGTRENGLNLYNPSTESFTRFSLGAKNASGFSGYAVPSITEDVKGNIWVGTNQGILILEAGQDLKKPGGIQFTQFNNKEAGAGKENIRSVLVSRGGTVWISRWGNGLSCYNQSTGKARFFFPKKKNADAGPINFIKIIYEDPKGNIWLGSYGGLMKYDDASGTFVSYSSDAVLSLFEDKSGIIWTGTFGGGLKMYDRKESRFKRYHIGDVKTNIKGNGSQVFAIYEDRYKELWVGTFGGGLYRYDKTRKNITVYKNNPSDKLSISDNNVYTICEAADGDLWIGTAAGLNKFSRKSGKFERLRISSGNSKNISFNHVAFLLLDKRGFLWMGTTGLDRYNPSTNSVKHYIPADDDPHTVPSGSIASLYQDNFGTVWIGITGKGVFKYIPETDSFKKYSMSGNAVPGKNTGSNINNNTVLSTYVDGKGHAWFGTNGGGLNCMDIATELFTYYTVRNGLPNDVIYGILPDNSGNLWLSTNNGITRFNPYTKQFRNYDEQDGLQAKEFNQGAYFAGSNGELFFGGIKDLNSFFPNDLNDNMYLPPVYVTSFKVFDRSLHLPNPLLPGTKIELEHSQNFFSFEFVALNYTSPGKNQYAYKLDGFDNNWHYVSAMRRYASYTNLDPGKYVLHVRGSNNDGKWNKAGTFVFIIIKPPFWMTWWFKAIMILLALAGLYLFYRIKANRFKELERLRVRIASDLHDDIGAALTRISMESEMLNSTTDPSESRLSIQRIGNMSREIITSMSDVVWSIDSRNDSIESLIGRMKDFAFSLFSIKNVRVIFDISGLNPQKKIKADVRQNIYLIFKEAINNAAKYSASESITITIANSEGKFKMVIDDPGTDFLPKKYTGQGLRNMKLRSERIGGDIEFINNKGFKIVFKTDEL